MKTKVYEPHGTDVDVLRIKHLWVKLQPGNNAEELVDKIEALIKKFSLDGDWTFDWDIE